MITVSKEDYLKSILEAESEGEEVIAARLADLLKVSPPAVTMALREYIKSKKRLRILDMFGKVDFWPGYDYKAARRRGNKRIPKSQPSRNQQYNRLKTPFNPA